MTAEAGHFKFVATACMATVVLAGCGVNPSPGAVGADVQPTGFDLDDIELLDSDRILWVVGDRTLGTDALGVAPENFVISELQREAAAGQFAGAQIVVAGANPADLVVADVAFLCTETSRQCSDPTRTAALDAVIAETVSAAFAAPVTGNGTAVLAPQRDVLERARPGDRVVIVSDLLEHSDVADINANVSLATDTERAELVDLIATNGIDFSTLELGGIDIDVALLATEESSTAQARFLHLEMFVEQLLHPAPDLNVTAFAINPTTEQE